MFTTLGTPPPLRRVAAILVGAEALALVVIAIWIGLTAVIGGDGTAMAIAIALTALVVGVPLAWASRSLWRGATWPRGLALTWQLLQAAAGVTVLDFSTVAGAATIAVAALGAAVIFVDARRDAPRTDSHDSEEDGTLQG